MSRKFLFVCFLIAFFTGCSGSTTGVSSIDHSGVYRIVAGEMSMVFDNGTTDERTIAEEDEYVLIVSGGPGIVEVAGCYATVSHDGAGSCISRQFGFDPFAGNRLYSAEGWYAFDGAMVKVELTLRVDYVDMPQHSGTYYLYVGKAVFDEEATARMGG